MTRLLVVGVGPRPSRDQRRVVAPGLRLDSIARALEEAGHDVHVRAFAFGGAAAPGALPPDPAEAGRVLSRACADLRPDAVVALSDVGALAAVLSGFEGPLFADYFGHPMAERQMLAAVHGCDDGLAAQWHHVLPVLLRADAFGVCSRAQRHALWGELGAVGRMNAALAGADLVRVLRPANPFHEPFAAGAGPLLGERGVPPGAPVVLFSGGYNTWLDEALLFAALNHVMTRRPEAWFVSTGGRIEGHVNGVFDRFEERVKGASWRERAVFLGWVEHGDFERACLEATVGISCDRWTLEGEFGCRNRLFGWLWAGMRAVASDASELTADLARDGLVRALGPCTAADLGEAVLAELQLGRRANADDVRARLAGHYAPASCYAGLLEWAAAPAVAPDRRGGAVDNALADEARGAEAAVALARRLAGSRAWRSLAALKPEWDDLARRGSGRG
jgi:hypothetical protein